jgi:WD40 repeat protein
MTGAATTGHRPAEAWAARPSSSIPTRPDEAVAGPSFVHGGRLAAITASGSIWLADGSSGGAHRLGGHAHGGLCLAAQPGGTVVATGGQDGSLRLWETRSGEALAVIDVDAAWVWRVG